MTRELLLSFELVSDFLLKEATSVIAVALGPPLSTGDKALCSAESAFLPPS